MIFDWYQLFNLTEFEETDLVSMTVQVTLEGIGQKDILITRGYGTSVIYDDVFLPVEFGGKNPYVREGATRSYAVFKDSNSNVWLGIETEQ